MRNWYYLVWADAIRSIRKNHPNEKHWKSKIFIYITFIHSLNLALIVMWLKYFKLIELPKFNIDLFGLRLLDGSLSFFIEFGTLFLLLNYLLIFRNNRYEILLEKYSESKVRYFLVYFLSVLGLILLSIILLGIMRK